MIHRRTPPSFPPRPRATAMSSSSTDVAQASLAPDNMADLPMYHNIDIMAYVNARKPPSPSMPCTTLQKHKILPSWRSSSRLCSWSWSAWPSPGSNQVSLQICQGKIWAYQFHTQDTLQRTHGDKVRRNRGHQGLRWYIILFLFLLVTLAYAVGLNETF